MASKEERRQIDKWRKSADYQELRKNRKHERKHTPKKPKRRAGKIAQKRATIQTRLRQARTDRYMSSGWVKIPLLDGKPLEEWKKIAKNGKTIQEQNEAKARINALRIQEEICHFWVHNTNEKVIPSGKSLDLLDLDIKT